MAYSDFTLKKVKLDFNIKTIENNSLFSNTEAIEISTHLTSTLKRNVPLALAINTEKARSELIIINILLEVKEKLSDKISLFSGIDFNVDIGESPCSGCETGHPSPPFALRSGDYW